jgi:hypothetical protein
MRNRELKTRAWRLEVRDDDLRPCFEILFGAVDSSIANFGPDYRRSVESLSLSTATLLDAFDEVRATLTNVRDTLARADHLMIQLGRQSRGREEGL